MHFNMTLACIGSRSSAATIAAVVLVGTLGLARLAPGQALGETPAERARISQGKLQRVVDTSLGSALVGPTPVFTLESTSDSTTANALVGVQHGDLSLTAKFSGPVRKGAATEFADFDGLRNKASVELGLGWLYWNVADPVPALQPACERLAVIRKVSPKSLTCTLMALRAAEASEGVPLVPYIDPGTAVFLTIRVGGAREDFSYLEPTTLASANETRASSSLAVAAGLLTKTNWMLGATYRHDVSHMPGADPTEVCRSIEGTSALRCDTRVIGVPIRKPAELVQVEFRKFLGAGLAISPRLTRNFTTNVTLAEMPLYFLQNSEGGLTGGTTIRWRSDQRGPSVVVFVGAALTLLAR